MSKRLKICIVASSLAKGGAERSSAILSQMLCDIGHEIHIVTVLSGVEYPFSGVHFNLGELKDRKDGIISRVNRLRVFKKYLDSNKIDVIIDNRSRIQAYREFLITKFIYNIPTIYVLHNYRTSKVFTKYKWLNKYLYKDKIITAVSEAATLKFKEKFKLKHIQTIYNGFDFNDITNKAKEQLVIENDFIIFYGRIDDEHKNLKLLLDAYKVSKLPQEGIKLLVLGDGPDYNSIVEYSKSLKLENSVIFKGFIANPYPFVKNARFMVLSSRFEGFPMVIPETLSLEVPVISVDCKSGPNEVIINGVNGLLVKNFDKNALSKAMNSFIFDQSLYQNCKKNAKKSVLHLENQFIKEEWKQLLNELKL